MIDNGLMTIDNQPHSTMQQTTHSTRQNNHLAESMSSTVSSYDGICDETLNFGSVCVGASAVDPNGGERGPSLCNGLQQKQSFESLDDFRGFYNNDAITTSMASHLSPTSIATSLRERWISSWSTETLLHNT